MDVGTSGGVWGFERGYCMMIGGDQKWFADSILFSPHSRRASAMSRARRDARSSAELPNKVICIVARMVPGHFVKMVHNGIEYGMMAAYAEGLGILRGANIGKQQGESECRDHAVARS